MFIHLSEGLNPFPTHMLEHIPLGEPAKHQFDNKLSEGDMHKIKQHPMKKSGAAKSIVAGQKPFTMSRLLTTMAVSFVFEG